MYNRTDLLHAKHNLIKNRVNYNFIFNNKVNINHRLKLFKYKRISQSNNDRTKSMKTTQISSNFHNINKDAKKLFNNEHKSSTIKRTRYSFVRFNNKQKNTFSEADFKTTNLVNSFTNNININKRLTRHRPQIHSKYYSNNNLVNYFNYNQTKNSNSNLINGSKDKSLKSKVMVIGGIAYRVTRNKLTKKLSPKEVISKTKIKYSSTSTSSQSKEPLNSNNDSNKVINKLVTDNKSVNNSIDSNNNNSQKCKILLVRGIKYEMDANGKTIRQVQSNGQKTTPKGRKMSRLDIGGVTYRCSKPGLFVSTNAERVRQLRNRAIKSSINRILLAKRHKSYLKEMRKKHCIFYCRFGRCNQGVNCPYIHDKDKIAVCSRFIRGTCKATDCPFSHAVAPEKMPVCSFFLQGRCSSDSCPYRHVKVNSDAEICKDFLRGYCPKGVKCKSAHVFVCVGFNRNGKCSKGDSCRLPHTTIGAIVKKKSKARNPLSPKSAKQLLHNHNDSQTQSQPLPSFIPLSTDNNSETDAKSSLNVDKVDTNSSDLPPTKAKEKVKYFWIESDEENSQCPDSDTDDSEEKACRPTIRIIPRFLFD